jgi:hypothetical protein
MAHPPIDPFGSFARPTGTPSVDADAARAASMSDPDFDPERTTTLSQTPPSPPLPHPLSSGDPERTALVAKMPSNVPPPMFTSDYVPPRGSGPVPPPTQFATPSRPPSYAPPPVFSVQYAPEPPRKSRRPLILAVAAACAVLAVVLVVVLVVNIGGGGSDGGASTPREAAKGYLEALARGDAAAALAFGQSVPPSKDLLTNDVLARQLKAAPITGIEILDDGAPVGDDARVHVSAKFGGQHSDTKLVMRRTGGGWKLVDAAVKLDYSDYQRRNPGAKDLTIFGQRATDPVYVFPGWVDHDSSNSNLVVNASEPLLDQLETFLQYGDVHVDLSPNGQDAINTVLTEDLAKCTASNRLAPSGCPLKVDPASFVDGTAQWGAMTDLTHVPLQAFDPHTATVALDGTVETTFTAQTPSGATTTGKLTGIIHGTADVTTEPPTITYR